MTPLLAIIVPVGIASVFYWLGRDDGYNACNRANERLVDDLVTRLDMAHKRLEELERQRRDDGESWKHE